MYLNANKSNWWRNYYLNMASVLCKFLLENDLLLDVEPFDKDGTIRENLLIKSSNLTPTGIEMFKKIIPNWSKSHERGAPIEKITILEKGLAKIRAIKP